MKPRDLSVLLAVILIIIMLIIPLPGWLLSILILCNISLALIVILVSMNTKEPLQFSIFPSLLLLLTLFRLGLNVSTTRSILSKAEAGGVVDTFGSFVIGDNPLVGFVVFLILVIIQYIVITKGAERVSEVSARFTLDAMPGKQMSIDADLNSGLITEMEARERREKVENEADFHGAMDGASKFVKGDAIAGIIIVIINIIFGIIIGMVQMEMSFGEAIETYMRLTVGDGLVSQIPALLIATATGIVVTRITTEGNLGSDVTDQLLQFPKLLFIAAGTIFMLGLTPINFMLTFSISSFLAIGGYLLLEQAKVPPDIDGEMLDEDDSENMKTEESVVNLLSIDPIEFEFGYGLIPLVDAKQGGDLLDRIVMIRRQLAIDLGIVIPVVRIRDNIQLEPNEYRIKLKGNEVASGEILLDHYLAMTPDIDSDMIEGIETKEPAFGLPAKWISEANKDEAELFGYTVVDPPSVVSTHLTEELKKHAHILLGRQETKELIDHLQEDYTILVEEVTPNPLSVGDIQKVLAKLLQENISIRNLPVIFETLADYSKMTNDTDLLTEYVRQSLSVQITKQYVSENNHLKVITTSVEVENLLTKHVQQTEHGNYLALDPQMQDKIIKNVYEEMEKASVQHDNTVLLCSPTIRMYMKQLLERALPQLPIISYNEVEPNVQVQSVGGGEYYMRVKKYTATTMNNALVQIKEELGPDAVILNSKPIKKGGIFGLFQKKHIEVIAALDENPVIKKREATEALQINRVDRAVVPPIKAQSDQTDILEEIKQLRQLVKGKSFQSHQSFSAPFDTFYSYLLEQEVNETVAENVVMDMEKHVDNDQTCTFTHFREFLQRQLNSVIEAPLSIHQKVVQFVGPTGVGKTTTIAKVAAKLMLEQKRKIAFITTDTYRIAAIEQLKTYAKILDVPLEVVYTRDDYDKALELFQDFDHIFVDTAGRNYREPHYVEELKNMIKITDERESVTFLVLSLTAKSQDNDEIYHIFKRVGINQVIFTKADETNTYGTIVNISIGDGAKIGYISNGQNVPDDLMKATSSHMTDLIFSRYRYV